jgi:hypothetical protein
MKSIIESTTLSMDGIKASIATEYSQNSMVRLPVVSDVKKAKLLTSILAIVSIVLPFAFWYAWQAHPSLG